MAPVWLPVWDLNQPRCAPGPPALLAGPPPRTPEQREGLCQQTRANCWQAAPRAAAKFRVFYNLKLRTPPASERTCVSRLALSRTCADMAPPAEPLPLLLARSSLAWVCAGG